MTKPCEKLFKKLPRNQQEWVRKRIHEICKKPSNGDKFRDPSMKGLLHTHARGSASNLLLVWSTQKNPEKLVVVEAVGSHKKLDSMQLRRTTFKIS